MNCPGGECYGDRRDGGILICRVCGGSYRAYSNTYDLVPTHNIGEVLDLNNFAPEKRIINMESPEGNCMEHYSVRRAWDAAYWAAIRYAYDCSRRGLTIRGANLMAWNEYVGETTLIRSCH